MKISSLKCKIHCCIRSVVFFFLVLPILSLTYSYSLAVIWFHFRLRFLSFFGRSHYFQSKYLMLSYLQHIHLKCSFLRFHNLVFVLHVPVFQPHWCVVCTKCRQMFNALMLVHYSFALAIWFNFKSNIVYLFSRGAIKITSLQVQRNSFKLWHFNVFKLNSH